MAPQTPEAKKTTKKPAHGDADDVRTVEHGSEAPKPVVSTGAHARDGQLSARINRGGDRLPAVDRLPPRSTALAHLTDQSAVVVTSVSQLQQVTAKPTVGDGDRARNAGNDRAVSNASASVVQARRNAPAPRYKPNTVVGISLAKEPSSQAAQPSIEQYGLSDADARHQDLSADANRTATQLDCKEDLDEANEDQDAPAVEKTVLIKDMTPTSKPDLVLHAYVVARGPVRSWENFRGSGELQEVLLADTRSDYMRATLFNDAVSKFQHVTIPGTICALSGGKIKFSFARTREREITLGDKADIRRVRSNTIRYDAPCMDLPPLADLARLRPKSTVNIIGVLVKYSEAKRVMSAQGKTLTKRELVLIDESSVKVFCTLWGNQARDEISDAEGQPVAIKGGELSDYAETRSVTAGAGAIFMTAPALPRTTELSAWYATGIDHASFPAVCSP